MRAELRDRRIATAKKRQGLELRQSLPNKPNHVLFGRRVEPPAVVAANQHLEVAFQEGPDPLPKAPCQCVRHRVMREIAEGNERTKRINAMLGAALPPAITAQAVLDQLGLDGK